MRNLKKLFAVILVVAMMASFMIPAFAAPSDVVGSDIEDEVARLVALGIITGREDGKFYPNDTITRAEFAAVVIRSLGYGSAADAAKGQTKFSDVKADFWASGYINLASSLGIIKGRPDGSFGANDKVLYEEAVTMIIRALGYEPAATARGGYPTGYLTIASQEDIDDGAVAAVGAPASRGLVAKLVDNSLEVAMMIQVGYGTEQKYVKSGTEDTDKQTLLDSKLKLDVREGTIQSVNLTKGELKIKIDVTAPNVYGDDNGITKTFKVFAGLSFGDLENAKVTIWKKDDVIYNIDSDTVVYYDYITKINNEDDGSDIDKLLNDIDTITLNKAGTFDVAEDTDGDVSYELYKNDAEVDISTNRDNTLLDGEVFAKVFVDDGVITRIEGYTVLDANVGIVKAVSDSAVTMIEGTNDNKKITGLKDANTYVNVYVDGVAKTLADLKEDMVLQYAKTTVDGDTNHYFIASTKTSKGTLTAAKSGKVTIAGTATDLFGGKFYSTDGGDTYTAISTVAATAEDQLKDFLGEEVFGYVTYRGKIAYLKGTVETTDFYGILEETFSYNEQIKVTRDVDGDVDTLSYETDLTSAEFDALEGKAAAATDTAANRSGRLYKFSVDKDNVITNAALVGATPMTDVLFNKDSDYIRNAANTTRVYTDDALLLLVTNNDDIEILKWSDIEGTDLATKHLTAYYDAADDTPEVILLADTVGDISFSTSDKYFGWVTSKSRISSDDYEIVLNSNDGSKTLTVDDGYLGTNTVLEKSLAIYTLSGDEGRAKISVASYVYNDKAGTANVVYPGLNLSLLDLDGAGFDYEVASNEKVVLNGVDGNKVKVTNNSAWFALASDAVVYKIDTTDNNYNISDVSSIDEDGTTNVSFFAYKGKIKFLFFWD